MKFYKLIVKGNDRIGGVLYSPPKWPYPIARDAQPVQDWQSLIVELRDGQYRHFHACTGGANLVSHEMMTLLRTFNNDEDKLEFLPVKAISKEYGDRKYYIMHFKIIYDVIDTLKTIYVKGQQLYFDGFDALSFDTQPSSNIKSALEYIIDDNNLIDDLLENEKEHQFSVKTIKDNKYFSISKLRKGEQKPINNKPGRAHNPLINNKKELNILQKCLLKHYFNIDIGTKPLTNIPIQIISYIRSIEKLFVLYISEIINSLNNQYYNLKNNDNTNKNHSDLYGKTDFGYTNHYQNNDKQKDECIAFVKKHLYLYKNIVSNVSIKKNNESKEQVRKLLQILSFIRNNHVLGLFYHQNSCNCNQNLYFLYQLFFR